MKNPHLPIALRPTTIVLSLVGIALFGTGCSRDVTDKPAADETHRAAEPTGETPNAVADQAVRPVGSTWEPIFAGADPTEPLLDQFRQAASISTPSDFRDRVNSRGLSEVGCRRD